MRVEVYWNIRRRLYSVRALEGPDRGRVVARLPGLVLTDAEFRVSAAGRDRARREWVKNVHALVRGNVDSLHGSVREFFARRGGLLGIVEAVERLAREATQVTYDPYLDDHFRDDRGARVERADEVWLRTDLRGGKARAQVLAFGVS